MKHWSECRQPLPADGRCDVGYNCENQLLGKALSERHQQLEGAIEPNLSPQQCPHDILFLPQEADPRLPVSGYVQIGLTDMSLFHADLLLSNDDGCLPRLVAGEGEVESGVQSRRLAWLEDIGHSPKEYLDGVRSQAVACIRGIHASIFSDLFAWAGRWRTVQISKPGAIWPPPHYLDEAMQSFESDVLMKYPAESLTTEDAFCAGLAGIQGEFLAIHPFREGNARTIKLLTDLLAAQTGRPLLAYDTSEAGCHEYIEAARTALIGQGYAPLETIIRQALHQAL